MNPCYKQLFDTIDTDQNGKISYCEFTCFLKSKYGCSDGDCDNLFNGIDTDKNSEIDLDEFIRFYSFMAEQEKQKKMAQMRLLFKEIDTDNNGFLSYDEVKHYFKIKGFSLSSFDFETFNKVAHNGLIDINEFVECFN